MSNKQWPKKKISWLFDVIGSGTTPSASNEIFYNSPDMAWLNTGDLTDSYIEKTSKYVSQQALDEFSALTVFPKDSLVMAMYGATIGKLGITKYETTTNQACCVLAKPREVITKYIFYWLLGHRAEIINLSQGGGQPNISQGIIRNIRIAVPPVVLQNKIVTFIDKKFEETNHLINKKEKMIKLLEEQRQSIITEAVTKGLNPNVKMKDTGVEWIGGIPEHWEVTKIKYTTYVKGRIGWQGLKSDEFIDEGPFLVTGTDFIQGYINWETCYHISEERYNEAPPIQLQENDLLITKDGTIGKLAIVKEMPYKAILNSGVFVTRPFHNKYLSKYMYWLLSSTIFEKYIKFMETGSTIKHLYQETFVNFSYPIPSIVEQTEILKYLDIKIGEIDSIKSNLVKQIEKLKEYRQSLIYEAVTGKIDVRDMELDLVR
ncbi:restriction endonuclease subunit S [Bacillus subtilis]|uniref:restriction endonuclease subunit S n=1 Tax=Bacillus subtilis TaxID=1423 RepID=UPI0013B7BC34|nr:restriction endonuclease subunit S [Bacillus subtilis]KAF2425598.1 restriction endonuclease subunit S [Bacillus subtilis]